MTFQNFKPKYNNSRPRGISEGGFFKTADFVLSVFLLYSGIELVKAEAYPDDKNPNRKYFVFKKTEQLEEIMNHYIADDPTVKLRKFMTAQKEIKTLIYETK